MFIYYLHGSQLASASSHYRAEPQRDRPLKESAKDIISVFFLTLSKTKLCTQFTAKERMYNLNFWQLKVLDVKLSV